MSKRTRKIVGLLMGLLMILSVVAPATAMAAVAPEPLASPGARPETGDLIIHKLQFNDAEFSDNLIVNNGLPQEAPAGSFPLADVEFTIYPVSDDVMDPGDVDISDLSDPRSGTTDNEGKLSFNSLPAGRYYVMETDTPDGVEFTSPPFLVDVPMMHPDGDRWNEEVYVYPKNHLILGAVELIKYDEDGETGLVGAQFDLFKGIPDDGVPIESFTTDANGKIFVGELVIGDYYFVETAAPAGGYGLNNTPIEFSIGFGDHAYTSGNDSDSLNPDKVIRDGIELTNFLLPANINKYVTSIPNKSETANFFEDITWIIVPDVPADIARYHSFEVIDRFGPEMDYTNNLKVYADDQEITSFNDSYDNGELRIEFISLEELSGIEELRIEFTTAFNETAIMGKDYFNNVDLEFDSGFVKDTITAPDPPRARTGGKPFIKVNQDEVPLPGAEFMIQDSNGNYLQPDYGWGVKETGLVLYSSEDGRFEIKGLAYGQYFLEETKSPEFGGVQYRLLSNLYAFDVDENSYYSEPDVIESHDTDPTADAASIENRPEITLPATGGMGTLLFSILGLGLMGTSAKLYKKSEKK